MQCTQPDLQLKKIYYENSMLVCYSHMEYQCTAQCTLHYVNMNIRMNNSM